MMVSYLWPERVATASSSPFYAQDHEGEGAVKLGTLLMRREQEAGGGTELHSSTAASAATCVQSVSLSFCPSLSSFFSL